MSHEHKTWWMSEDQRERAPESDAPAPDEAAEREMGRRNFLQRVGFGAALTASACASPTRQALPFVDQPETVTPGASSTYATLCGGCAASCGLLVEVRDGRPIKIEGNPSDPVSQGGVCATGHAAPMALYDESRPARPTIGGENVGWTRFDAEVRASIERARAGGKDVVLLTGEGPRSSPSTRALVDRFIERTGARHVAFEPVSSTHAIAQAHEASHGSHVVPDYRFERADVVVSLGADFLGTWIAPVAFARRWAALRRPDRAQGRMSRVYQLEGRMSLTGTNADERIRLAPSARLGVLAAVTRRLLERAGASDEGLLRGAPAPALDDATLDRMARDLFDASGRALVISDSTHVQEQLLVNWMNELIGAYGHTLDLESVRPAAASVSSLEPVLADARAGRIGVLIVWGANPVYASPQGAAFRDALEGIETSVVITDRRTETAAAARYVAPETHFMESWADAEPRVGAVAVRQPTLRALAARQPGQERLLRFMGERGTWLDALRASWAHNVFPESGEVWFTGFWDRIVRDGATPTSVRAWAWPDGAAPRYGERTTTPLRDGGMWAGSAATPPAFDRGALSARYREAPIPARGEGELELVTHADLSVGLGQEANNPWLQEAPDPITKVSWDNHVSVSPRTAERLHLELGDVVAIAAGELSLEAPVIVQPGQHDRVVSIALGYGRTHAGPVGDGVGVDAWPLVDGEHPDARNVSLRRTGRRVELARTQTHLSQEGRNIVREATLGEYLRDARAPHGREPAMGLPLWRAHGRPGRRWGMTIDLNACIGCTACVVSCQVENNVPVVGKEEVQRFRDMHWIRIDRYFGGENGDPDVVHQPMLCQHCDNAPCETVCPALATMQSAEGLNQMIYNRCVGTRYCANNCPFKVRRFNWFDYPRGETANLALNPDVVVRTRGVMEKCSFCIQRIQEARWTARLEERELADGDVQTACQQSCPTQAITFGDLNDPESEVTRRRADPRAYRLLADLHVEPVVHYMARIRNREEG